MTTSETTLLDTRTEALEALRQTYCAKGFYTGENIEPAELEREACWVIVEWSPGYKFIYLTAHASQEDVLKALPTINGDTAFNAEFVALVMIDLDTGKRLEPRPTAYELHDYGDGESATSLSIDGFTDGREYRPVC